VRVAVLGSGSQGNAVAVQYRDTTLLLDCGFGPRALKRRAAESGLSLNSVSAIVLTHEHGDHARGAGRLATDFACPVYGSSGTLNAIAHDLDAVETIGLESHRPVEIERLTVTACRTSHDAAEPLALRVDDLESGAGLGLAYDIGRSSGGLRHLLRECSCIVVEANHDDLMLRTGPYPPSVRRRIAGSGGHLSNRAAGELLADLVHDGLGTVVLAHLSHTCNDPYLAAKTVGEVLRRNGFSGRLLVARQKEALPAFTITGRGDAQCTLPLVG
jgi:phosphoribosyl 1,2-cyclic phosphodiesterase